MTELDGSNNLLKSFTWGLDNSGSVDGAGGVQGLIGIKDHVNNKYYIPTYHNMNVSKLVDADDGSVVAEYEYSPFGKLIKKEGFAAELNNYPKFSKAVVLFLYDLIKFCQPFRN